MLSHFTMGMHTKAPLQDSRPWVALSTYTSQQHSGLVFAHYHAVECQIRQVGNLGFGLYHNAKRGPGGSCLHCRSQCWSASQLHSHPCCHWHHHGAVSRLHPVLDVSSFCQLCCVAAPMLSLALFFEELCTDTAPGSSCLTALQCPAQTGFSGIR
jgi:hypothetical protein